MTYSVLSHYELAEKIGEGGMGAVYRARDTRLDREVALKVLNDESLSRPDRRYRFLREARSASRLNHPNIVTIYEVGEDHGVDFIAMELIRGQSLETMIAGRPLSENEALRIALQVADALACAESARIVHRDLKPGNLIVTATGLVKILDFGLAKPVTDSDSDVTATVLTVDGVVLGTPSYMSPEQAEGRAIDTRSDLFSFGVVLYEMLTGLRAFERTSSIASILAVLKDEPPRATLPDGFEKIVRKCLAKDPAMRYQSAVALRCALEELRTPPAAGAGGVRQPARTIAVLPFTDMSPHQDQAYFCDGIAEEILNSLMTIDGLKVASRTSAFRFRDSTDIADVGRQLRVDNVLEGSVRTFGERLRISTQLIDVNDGYHLWSQRYDRQMADIFSIQDEIAQAIGDTFRMHLDKAQAQNMLRRQTSDAGAYQLYLQGRYFWNKRTPQSVERAMEYFQKAIDRDPGYVLAYSGLADCYSTCNYYSAAPPRDLRSKAHEAASKAVQFGGFLSEPHASLGLVKANFDYDVRSAESDFRKAIELNPNNSTARYFLAFVGLAPQGRLSEAIEEIEIAESLEPLSLPILCWKGFIRYLRGEYGESIAQYRRALEVDDAFPRAYTEIALALLAAGDSGGALDMIREAEQRGGESARTVALRGYARAISGDREAGERSLMELALFSGFVGAIERAILYLGLNEINNALDAVESAYEERSPWLVFLRVWPLFEPLRGQPRFERVVRAIGI